jgi:GntR family transcriptional regulator
LLDSWGRILSKPQSNRGRKGDSSPRPRFLQIADEIRDQIANGALKEHDILPSERSLSEEHNVSRMTGRRALEALETEGLVYSADRRGRFVSPKRLNYNISNMVSFVSNAQTNNVGLNIELVDAAETTAGNRLAALLELEDDSAIIAYTRLFHTGAHPIFIETEYLLTERFPDFLEHDLRQSTTKILEEKYGISAATGDIVIRMRGVHADEAQLLNIAASHTVIELEQVIRDGDGVPFCFGRQVWRGEMAEFSAHAIVTGY